MINHHSKDMSNNTRELTPESVNYMESTPIEYRKRLGQYFTPKTVREALLSCLPHLKSPMVLDPACGTGEFLLSCQVIFDKPSLYGIEIDSKLSDIAKSITNANIMHYDALKCEPKPIYDLVVGNPPYFEFKPEPELKARYKDVISGRANIFAMFVKLGLDYLKEGGFLAYVIPPSMNNGAYFNSLRRYIRRHSTIKHLSLLENETIFHKAQQTVMLLVLRKEKPVNDDFIFERNGIVIFSEAYKQLREKYEGSVSIKDLGYKVKTGTIVWNQHKDKLTDDPSGAVPLIWSHNIQDNRLVIPLIKEGKPQYIRSHDYEIRRSIVVNRVTGTASKAKLKAAIIPSGMRYLAENHINLIYKSSIEIAEPHLDKDLPDLSLEQLHQAIIHPTTIEIMRSVTGNTQISKTELERLLPVFL